MSSPIPRGDSRARIGAPRLGAPGIDARRAARARVLVVTFGLSIASWATGAAADVPQPAPAADDARATASAHFEAARRAFEVGDYLAAAQGFEAAHAAAPHPSALWNAARSWHRAGDPLRAAWLYQRYLREAPPGAPDRDAALADLALLEPRLGRVAVVAPGASAVTVDGRALDDAFAWVLPGSHVVEARFGDDVTRVGAEVTAGGFVSVAALARREDPAPSTRPSATPDATVRGDGGWPAWSILPFVGATALAAGGLVASGVDTLNLRDEYDASAGTSRYAFENGTFAMRRTNVLVAVTAGLGAITLGVALFGVDWNGEAAGGRVVGVAGPGGLTAVGEL